MRELIESKRLKLRTLRMRDAPRIARYVGDPAVGRNLAMTPLPYLENAAEGWIMTLAARAPLKQDFVRAIEAQGEGLVGVIGAHKRSNGAFEIGYWIGRPFWGRGVATEALLAFAVEARALGPLQSGHFVDNPASGRVLEKGGFVYTGAVEPMFSLARGANVPCKRMRDGAAEAALDGRAAAACA
ncbi:MAG: GNAT family N-acetyltransferase [Hyphomonadaceae bacterium]|nr:GNAT family N-acetyltransferase [Hyphomonadaceae bacterium]